MAGGFILWPLTGTENFKMHCVIISLPLVERYGEYEGVCFYALQNIFLREIFFIYFLIILGYFNIMISKIFFIKLKKLFIYLFK
jgi:hypothetical protein